jgi:hypothetical protein
MDDGEDAEEEEDMAMRDSDFTDSVNSAWFILS